MTTVDRTYGDWYLTSISGNIFIEASGGAGTTSIFGNLVVVGSQTNIGSVNTYITDNIITLCANVTTGIPVLDAGIEVRRGFEPTVSFRWNEAIDRWQLTNDGIYWGNIMVRVKDDPDPHLGGNLYTDGYTITTSPGENLILAPAESIEIRHSANVATRVDGATILASRPPGPGYSGLYVTNAVSENEELITKRKSIIYSLVL
jgi:hypothetical protein